MITFTEDMRIGVPHIDSQHKALVNFINKVVSLCATRQDKEETKEWLDFLGNYVVDHFSDEEKLQYESNYPRYWQHKEIHKEFVVTFNSLYGEFIKNGPSADLSNAMIQRVSNWIITHIQMEDIIFGKYYLAIKSMSQENQGYD